MLDKFRSKIIAAESRGGEDFCRVTKIVRQPLPISCFQGIATGGLLGNQPVDNTIMAPRQHRSQTKIEIGVGTGHALSLIHISEPTRPY